MLITTIIGAGLALLGIILNFDLLLNFEAALESSLTHPGTILFALGGAILAAMALVGIVFGSIWLCNYIYKTITDRT